MYGGAGFAVGLDAVTAGFKEGEPTTIHWYTERSYVASSGDLGVSIGTIKPHDPKDGAGLPLLHRLAPRRAGQALALHRGVAFVADCGIRERPTSNQAEARVPMRSIEHFINGSRVADGTRHGDVWNPSQGEVQARVNLGTAATLQKAIDAARAAQPAWAATNPQRRARVMFKFKALVEAHMDELAELLRQRAWQGHRRRQGRHPARARSDRILLRHPARAEGRIYDRRRPRHRRLFDAPAARHRRRHHPVQLPGDDPDVDVRRRPSPRGNAFILKPSRARPVGAGAPRRADAGSRACPTASSTSSMATRKWSTRSSTIRTSRRSASSARPTSPSTSTRAAPRTGSGCRRSAAPRTMASSCPTPTSTRSSTTSPARPSARPASAAWRCRWWCRSATTPPRRCAKSWSRRSRSCGSASRPTPRRITARWSTRRTSSASRITSSCASTRAPSWWSTAAASPCRAMRRASSSARPCSTM